jgi:hypothetical protein
MMDLFRHSLVFFVFSFVVMWLSAWFGAAVLRKYRNLAEGMRSDFGTILAATLTLLGLIIGFSFSMAITRYDQRKNYEEAEANAIGTAYARADLLPAADGAKVRALLKSYLDQRVLYYVTQNETVLREVDAKTARLQNQLWSAVVTPATAQPTPVIALAVEGMNDVLNSQGYTQAAWWNQIPTAAWALMLAVAIVSNLLLGYELRNGAGAGLLLILRLWWPSRSCSSRTSTRLVRA